MTDTLLQTKLYIPPIRPTLVNRPSLIEKLSQRVNSKLTLVSAPAGFGKTTLVSTWVQQLEQPTAWLSLDENDNDLAHFLTYLIAAIQQIDEHIGVDIQAALQVAQTPPTETLLTALINEIATATNSFNKSSTTLSADAVNDQQRSSGQGFLLVLDDYHSITNQSIHTAINFLLTHLPSKIQLVITSRVDPPLPLSRLRVRGEMIEIRSDDLRFNEEEIIAFLNDLMGLNLLTTDITALEMRTEGWIAGLQLAALSIQGLKGHAAISNFIDAFTGDDRYIVDYLVDEVLAQQPKSTQNFLLQTAILERITGPLCDAVTGAEDGRVILDRLEQANLFVVPLDGRREWYRYHHLFADLLRHRLRLQQPELIPALYLRASVWFEAQAQMDEAIQYALLAKDWERATSLVDQIAQSLILTTSDSVKLLQLVSVLPEPIRQRYPRLCIFHAWSLVFERQLDAVEPILALAEAHLQDPSSLPSVYSSNQISHFAAMVRTYAVTRQGDLDRAEAISLQLLKTLSSLPNADALIVEGTIKINLGIIYARQGEVTSAAQTLLEAITLNQTANIPYATLAAFAHLIQLRITQGHLHQAMANGRQALDLIKEWSGRDGLKRYPVVATSEIYRELGRVSYQWNDLEMADKHISQALKLCEMTRGFDRIDCYRTLMNVNLAQSNVDAALDYLSKIESLSKEMEPSDWRLFTETEIVRGQIKLGQSRPNLAYLLRQAGQWADHSGLQSTDAFQPDSEHQYVTLARVLIAQDKADQALPLLKRLCQAAETGSRFGHLIEYLILQALAFQALTQPDQALSSLNQALILAQPEGHIRVFVDEGEPMAALLQQATAPGIATAYIGKLKAALSDTSVVTDDYQPETKIVSRQSETINLVEPLSRRELDVLRLIIAGLKNQEIAEELVVSLNTVRFHIKNVYSKLNVHSRSQAIFKAKELDIR